MIDEQRDKSGDRVQEQRICWEIVESVNSIILRWDTNLKVTFINDYGQRFLGYRQDEVLGKSLIGTIVPATSTAGRDLNAMIQGIIRHPEENVNNENENLRHDGTRVWISWTNRAIRDSKGNVVEILSVGNDITRRKRAEDALEKNLKMVQMLLDTIPVPVFYKDANGIYTGCNQAFADFLGKPKDEIIGRNVYEIAPRDLADIYHKADEELIHHPGKQVYETSVASPDGTRRDVVFSKATFFNEDGTVGGLIGTIIDITERKAMWQEVVRAREELEQRVLDRTKELEQANEFLRREAAEHKRDEDALRESEERFRAIFEQAVVGISITSLDGITLRPNDKMCQITGYSREELVGRNYQFFIYPEDKDLDKKESIMLLNGEISSYSVDKRFVRKGGKLVWAHVTISLARDKEGRPQYVIAIIQDITGRKEAEKALREGEEEFRVLVESSPVAIFFHQGGDFIYVNPAAERLTGYAKEQLLGMKFWEIIAPEYRAMVKERGVARLKGKKPVSRYEVRILTGDGAERWIELNSTLMEFKGKTSILTTALDATQRRQAEESMKKARTRAELYLDLMGHDISNMNQAMMGYLEIAQELLDLKGHEELIERPLEIIRHSSRLIASVKKLESIQAGKYPIKTVNLCQALKEVADAYAIVPERNVKINLALAEGCYVRANDLLNDVFDNFVDNAIRHSTGPLMVDISMEPILEDGRKYYMVSVSDNGPGIPDDLKRKIFRFIDPATGSPGRRGLGLYLVRTLVESYEGKVWVEDRIPGDYHKGSRFVVLLPAMTRTPEMP